VPAGIDRAPAVGMPASIMIDQAAEMLGVSRRTIYYRIHEGRLRTVRTRCGSQRVLVESIVALMREDRAPRGLVAGASNTAPFEKSPAL
jgi:excisionase family DNA binding protein